MGRPETQSMMRLLHGGRTFVIIRLHGANAEKQKWIAKTLCLDSDP
jgi:hypothetical protein